MRRSAISFLVLTGLLLTSIAFAKPTLKVGDKAPAIQVSSWVKGEPVKSFEKGKVYVVEFWATWCGPCKTSIPHLTEMAHKYKGKVNFVGVSSFEHPADNLAGVNKFVKEMGDKMDYNVAVDGSSGVMGKTWMDAADQHGIPTAFVVGKDSTINWIGHPMVGLDEVLGQVIADKFDVKSFAEKQAKAQEAQAKAREEQSKLQELLAPVGALIQSGKTKEGIAELDKVIAAHPGMEKSLGMVKLQVLQQFDEPAYYPYAQKLADGIFKDDAQMLNQLSWGMVDDKSRLKSPNFDIALKIAQRAVEVSKSQDAMILDTLAFAYYRKGNLSKAIEIQEKAVKQLATQKEIPEDARKDITDRLEMFKKKK